MGKSYTKNGKIIDQFSILKQVIDIREKKNAVNLWFDDNSSIYNR
jgi:hypothetical protein